MDRQKEVLKYLYNNGERTLSEILENVPFGYFRNGNKHMGVLLSRMVKNNTIERVSKGVFRFKNSVKSFNEAFDNPNQLNLLE